MGKETHNWDATSPTRSNPSPTGTLPLATTQTTLSLDTDENATCKYSTTAGQAYSAMTNTFSTTGGTTHSTTVTGLSQGSSYTYYVRCEDGDGNANTDDYPISFSIHSGQAIGYWSFNGPDMDFRVADEVIDRGSGGNDGNLINMGTADVIEGARGQALSFNGGNAAIEVGNVGSGIKTVAFRMKADDTTDRKILDFDGSAMVELNGSSEIVATNFPGTTTIYVDGEAGSAVTAASPGFTCGTDTVQDADGNSYNTVLIGTQCWMASNLNVGTRIDGANNQTDNATIEKYCYGDDPANCTTYGGLYQWDEAMQYVTTEGAQGICPAGWHIPSDAEQHTLDAYLATGTCDPNRSGWDCDPAGTELKTGGSSGFDVSLAGYRSGAGSFSSLGSSAGLWSGSQSGSNAFRRGLTSGSTVSRGTYIKPYGFSIRCLRNTANTAGGGKTEWHHVVITDTTGVNGSNFTIGEAGGSYFDGRLDEVELYTDLVSASEIPDMFKKGTVTTNMKGSAIIHAPL